MLYLKSPESPPLIYREIHSRSLLSPATSPTNRSYRYISIDNTIRTPGYPHSAQIFFLLGSSFIPFPISSLSIPLLISSPIPLFVPLLIPLLVPSPTLPSTPTISRPTPKIHTIPRSPSKIILSYILSLYSSPRYSIYKSS
jgi:hypothetical protein